MGYRHKHRHRRRRDISTRTTSIISKPAIISIIITTTIIILIFSLLMIMNPTEVRTYCRGISMTFALIPLRNAPWRRTVVSLFVEVSNFNVNLNFPDPDPRSSFRKEKSSFHSSFIIPSPQKVFFFVFAILFFSKFHQHQILNQDYEVQIHLRLYHNNRFFRSCVATLSSLVDKDYSCRDAKITLTNYVFCPTS